MDTYVVIDLETTGLNSKIAEIIEISALKISCGNVIDEFSFLVKPTCPIPPDVSSVNGITDQMVENAPYIKDVLPLFVDFVSDFPLVGYNICSYDLPILNRVLRSCMNITLNNDRIDVLLLAKKKLSFLPNKKLVSIAAYLGVDYCGAHRALNDCYITKYCYDKILEIPDPIVPDEHSKTTHKYKVVFSKESQALQTLHSLLLGIISDGVLSKEEVLHLEKWINDNSFLSGQYPYDRVFQIVKESLRDGVFDQCEMEEMLTLFQSCVSPVENLCCKTPIASLDNKIVCLTGEFEFGTKSNVESLIMQAGGICKRSVTQKTDFLIVGNLGNSDWSCGNYGGKIKKAMEIIDHGGRVQIIKENDLVNFLICQEVLS